MNLDCIIEYKMTMTTINQKTHEICPSCIAVASLMEQHINPNELVLLLTTHDSLIMLLFEQTLVKIDCKVYLKFTIHSYDLCFKLIDLNVLCIIRYSTIN